MEEEDDLLAFGRDVPRQLDDPLLLVVLQIQGAAIEEKQRMKEGRKERGWQFLGGNSGEGSNLWELANCVCENQF